MCQLQFISLVLKMKKNLKIAIPLAKNQVSADVERCTRFIRYEIDQSDNRVKHMTFLSTPPLTIKDRVNWLSEECVDILFYSGANPMVNALCAQRGIIVISGFPTGQPMQAINSYLRNDQL